MIHHVAITASNFEKSLDFYQKLGFVVLSNRHLPDKGKKIALLQLGNFKLELFWYEDSQNNPASRREMGNNVKEVGSKHFAIQVDSLEKTRQELSDKDITLASESANADTGYRYFFIRDPDGIWIEYVEDNSVYM